MNIATLLGTIIAFCLLILGSTFLFPMNIQPLFENGSIPILNRHNLHLKHGNLNNRFQYLDLLDESSVDKLPSDDVESVVDLSACLAELETPVERFFQINTLGVQKLLEFCRKNSIKKFVLTRKNPKGK